MEVDKFACNELKIDNYYLNESQKTGLIGDLEFVPLRDMGVIEATKNWLKE